MTLFLCGILALILGYFTYGRWIEHLLGPDDRPTPAIAGADGVDTLPLPKWKNLLIQLLNIAGVGPVIGVIIGIKFGIKCFWIIPLGCILGGAVHDYISGFISLRNHGINLPELTRRSLGELYHKIYVLFVIILLLLVVAVFVNIPSQLIVSTLPQTLPDTPAFWIAAVIILAYYIASTIFPVDRIIGKIYPLFGALLLIGTLAMFIALCINGFQEPHLLTETEAFLAGMFTDQPVIPCLFVTIACGIISGFHATQSPIVARTMRHERESRCTYYGMMITEGVIAMIWAAAGLAIYNTFPELMSDKPAKALSVATEHFLGGNIGLLTIFSVIILAITSGDTALRSLRLTLAEYVKVPQRSLKSRIFVCLPLLGCIGLLLWWSNQDATSFEWLWKYFAWGNQILAASTLMACTVWLKRHGKTPWVTLLPGAFMTFIVFSFILWSDVSHPGCPYGFNLPLSLAYPIAGCVTLICCALVWRLGNQKTQDC
ncbi:MAG: carbon starvation protein A [Kiritimatiellae bacterium]|nr:carbon starvation protein A [Kiritimatiellia bacterium]